MFCDNLVGRLLRVERPVRSRKIARALSVCQVQRWLGWVVAIALLLIEPLFRGSILTIYLIWFFYEDSSLEARVGYSMHLFAGSKRMVSSWSKMLVAAGLWLGAASAQTPAISFSPTAVTFSPQLEGTAAGAQYLYLYNASAQAVSFSSFSFSGPNAADFSIGYNSCTTGLPASGSCYIQLQFIPSIVGAESAQLNFTDNASASPQSVPLSGTGQGPTITLSMSASVTFAPQNVGTTSNSAWLYIQNTGNTAAHIKGAAISGTNPGDFNISSNGCTAPLPAGSECSIYLTFSPKAAGTRSALMTITDDATGSPQIVTLSGTGQAPTATLSFNQSSLNFGTQTLNTPSSWNLSVSNTGNVPITFSSAIVSGPNAGDFSVSGNTCSSPFLANYFCNIRVQFQPSAVGTRTAALIITDTASGSPQAFPLTGIGQSPAAATLTVSPASLTFASQGLSSTSSQSVFLQNLSPSAVKVSSIALSGPNASDFTLASSSPCTSLSKYVACTISVIFHPKAVGTRSAVLTITDTATGSPQTIPITGTGVVEPAVTFSPAALNFGNVSLAASLTKTLIIANGNSQAVPFYGANIDGADPQEFVVTANTCPAGGSLAANTSCSITVSFTPALPGARSANLTISDGATQLPQVIFLGGNGAAVTKTLAFQSLNVQFGSQPLGVTSLTQTLQVTNTGNAPVTFSSISVSGGVQDFTITENDCIDNTLTYFSQPAGPNMLASGSSCLIYISFTPAALGQRQASLLFKGDQVSSPQSIPVSGYGVTPGAILSVAPLQLNFGTEPLGVTTNSQAVNLENTGSVSLTLAEVSVTGKDAADFSLSPFGCGPGYFLQPGQNCGVTIAFTPSAGGVRSAALTLAGSVGNAPQTIPLTGIGMASPKSLTVNVPGIFYGGQAVGTAGNEYDIYLQNNGAANINLQSFNIVGTNASDFIVTSNFCAQYYSSLPSGQSCSVGVTFTPGAAGFRTASLSIVSDAANSPLVVPVNGVGLGAASNPLSVFPTTLHFSQPVGVTSAPQIATIANSGSQTINLNYPTFTGSGNFSYYGLICPNYSNTLAPGATCTVTVVYTPTAVSSDTATLGITSSAGTVSVALNGSGQNPSLTLSLPATVTFNSQSTSITSLPQAVTIQNTGNEALTLSNFAISGTDASDFAIDANSCPPLLPASSGCSLGITFKPGANGARTASLVITDNAGNSPQSIPLKGTGEATDLTLNFSTLAADFGVANLGAAATAQIAITNPGSSAIALSGYSISGGNAANFSISGNTCATTDSNRIPGGGTCTITITFRPSVGRLETAQLSISDNASGSPQTISLSGSGQAVAIGLALTPTSLDFGGVDTGANASQTMIVTNTGDVAVTPGQFSITGGNATDFSIGSSTCGNAPLAADSSCTLSVSFAPHANGVRTSTLIMAATSSLSAQTVAITGLGQATTTTASVLPAAYDFGVSDVGAAVASNPLAIVNTGTANLVFTSYPISGANAGDFKITGNTCASADSGILPSGSNSSCALIITFTPSASGVRRATLSFVDNAAGGTQTVALSGIGQANSKLLTMSPLSYDFGTSPVGTPVSTQFNPLLASNTGTAAVTISKVSIAGANASDFAVTTNSCVAPWNPVPAGGNCLVNVAFTPSASGARTAALQFFDDAGGSPQSIPLVGEGQATTMSLQVSPSPLLFTSPLGTALTRYVYLTNTGAASISVSNVSVSGTNAADFVVAFNSCQNFYPSGALPPAVTCSVQITFTPSVAGSETANLSVTDTASANPQTISLVGVGQSLQKVVSFNAVDLLFPTPYGTFSQQYLSWTPVGTAPVTVSNLTFGGTNASEFSVGLNTCLGQATTPGYYCDVPINYTPQAAGLSTGTVQITDDATGSTQSIILEGAGLAGGSVTLQTGLQDFGPVAVNATSQQYAVTFYNYAGGVVLTPGTPTLVGSNAADFSIVSTDCGAPLTADFSCSVYVTFTPSAVGPRIAAVQLPYSGGSGTAVYGLLGGNGTGGAGLAALNALAAEFDPATVNTVSSQSVGIQITNTGEGVIHFSSPKLSGANAADFFVYPNPQSYLACAATLEPGSSCQIYIGFSPSGTGLRTATLQVTGDASNLPQSISLNGVGQPVDRILYTSASAIDFGAQSIAGLPGQTHFTQITLFAGGLTNVDLSGLQITGPNASEFSYSTNCGSVLSPTYFINTCYVQITFTPVAVGLQTANLIITSDAPGSPMSIPLTGVGLPATNVLSFSEVSADFGLVNIGAQMISTINIYNAGGLPVQFSLPTITGSNAADFSIAYNGCANIGVVSSYNLNGTCTIKVAFTPSAVGQRTATLQVIDDAAGSPQTVSLFGTGQVVSYLLATSSSTVDFGVQAQGAPSNPVGVEIYNTGASPVTLSGISFGGANGADFYVDTLTNTTCAGTIAPGSSCVINVQFLPSVVGPEMGTMIVKSNSVAGPLLITLLGEGQKSLIRLNASSSNLDFGVQAVASTSPAQSLTILNSGNTPVLFFPQTISGAGAANFAAGPGTCTGSLAVNKSCTLSVIFTPSVTGPVSASLQISTTAPSSPTVTLTGVGK